MKGHLMGRVINRYSDPVKQCWYAKAEAKMRYLRTKSDADKATYESLDRLFQEMADKEDREKNEAI
jgi:hypothetical protein